jgi:hypothetical protein
MLHKYDPTIKYNLMIVTDMESGPDETIENLSAEEVLEYIGNEQIPEHQVFIENAATGKLSGLVYNTKDLGNCHLCNEPLAPGKFVTDSFDFVGPDAGCVNFGGDVQTVGYCDDCMNKGDLDENPE